MNYLCVIGDVVDSQKVQTRGGLQKDFKRVLEAINHSREQSLASPNTITLGDEYQAIYRDAQSLFQDFTDILLCLHPVKVRFSIAIGGITTPINHQMTLDMDGPVFHIARRGMDASFKHSGLLFTLASADKPVPPWIRLGLALISHQIRSWNANRLRILRLYLEGVPVKLMTQDLEISATAIYKNIQDGAMEPVAGLMHEIETWMNMELAP
jgi:hypothetical protein